MIAIDHYVFVIGVWIHNILSQLATRNRAGSRSETVWLPSNNFLDLALPELLLDLALSFRLIIMKPWILPFFFFVFEITHKVIRPGTMRFWPGFTADSILTAHILGAMGVGAQGLYPWRKDRFIRFHLE